MTDCADAHAASGVDAALPSIETWAYQYQGREHTIEIRCPEFTSVCPKTGLPDFATLILRSVPGKLCLELKSLKLYLLAHRNLGIFQEKPSNKVLDDVVAAAKPIGACVEGRFAARGGIATVVQASCPS